MILCFGLIRPYKGVDVLLEAFRGDRGRRAVGGRQAARMSMDAVARAGRAGAAGRVRFVARFVADRELPAYFRRADVVVLPYRDTEQSGVLFTALAFGKPIVMSAVGGFAEVAARGAGAARARRATRGAGGGAERAARRPRRPRAAVGRRAAAAAAGPYSWDAVAAQTLALYRELIRVTVARGRLLGRRPGCSSTRTSATRRSCGCWRGFAGPRRMTSRRCAERAAQRLADRRRPRRGGEHRALGRSTLALDYPRERLEVVVVSDGSTDRTAECGGEGRRRSGARGAARRQGRGAERRAWRGRAGEVLAFSDANSTWEPDALRRLVARLGGSADRLRLRPASPRGRGRENQEGLYWRYEMAVRALESRLAGVTAGNGAINAVRREAYIALEPTRGQDISFPFELTKRGWRAVFEPAAVARGADGGDARLGVPAQATDDRRRLGDDPSARNALAARLRARLRLRDLLPPALRYASPILHLIALAERTWRCSGRAGVYVVTLAVQLALLARGGAGAVVPLRAFRLARYYVAVTAASAAGLWDYLRAAACRRLGEGRGHAVRPRAAAQIVDLALAGDRPGARRARSLLVAAIAIKLDSRGPGDLPPAAGRQGRRRVRALQAADDAAWGRPGGRRHAGARGRSSRHPGRARCCAASRSTSSPTSSTCCAARWRSSAPGRRSPPRSSCTRRASGAGSR